MSRNKGVENTAPCGGQKKFDGSNVVVGGLGVDGAKGDGRRNDSNEKEEGNGNGLGVEVCHFLDPPGTNGTLKVGDDSSSKCLFGNLSVAAGLGRVTLDGSFIAAKSAARSSSGLPVAESRHVEESKLE